MRIFFLLSWYRKKNDHNHGIFFLEQAKALKNQGHEVVLLYAHVQRIKKLFSNEKVGPKFSHTIDEGVPLFRFDSYIWVPKIKNSAFYYRISGFEKLFNKAIKKYGPPDILHAQSCLWAGVAGVEFKRKYSIPLVISEHSSAYRLNKINEKDLCVASNAFKNADLIVYVSSQLKNDVEDKVEHSKPSAIIPNIVDVERFKKNDYKSKEFIYISVAGLHKGKAIDVLIKSFSKLIKNISNARLLIIGDGPERTHLEALTKSLELSSHVQFTGAVQHSRLHTYFEKSNVFVLPSRYETFGVVFIEALASGKPVVATKCGGPQDIINTNNGLLVEIDNQDALYEAMMYIYRNYSKYDRDEIHKNAIEKYCSKSFADNMNNIYQKLLDGDKK